MAKPQQAELRRSGKVPALDPDATETRLSAQDVPTTSGRTGKVPVEQQPGHHPAAEQDKPDLDKFAARFGIVPDDELPPDAPHVEEDSTVTRLRSATERSVPTDPEPTTAKKHQRPAFSPIGLALVGPLTGILIAKKVLQRVKRLRS